MPTGWVSLSRRRQYFRGYCFFTANSDAREIHDMPADLRRRHLFEMTLVAEAVQAAFGAVKMNVACFGNTLPLVHWNIIPRYGTDPLPGDSIWSIDPAVVESVVLPGAELETVRQAVIAALRTILVREGVVGQLASTRGK